MQIERVPSPLDLVRADQEPMRILVIDDDPETAIQIRMLLDDQGSGRHIVECASDVDSVFGILERTKIALVITEVRLGGEDISELIKSLKHHQPDIVTLALSTYQDSTALVELINQAQLYRYMLKPMRRSLVWRSIESGLKHHQSMRSTPVLANRHKVEKSSADTDSPTGRRLLGFFRNLGKKPN